MTTMQRTPVHADALTFNVVLFARLLRRVGLTAGPDQARLFARVLALVGFDRRSDVRAAGRSVFVRRREERALFDAAFDLFFRRGTALGGTVSALPRLRQTERRDARALGSPASEQEAIEVVDTGQPASASSRERLHVADFAELTADEARDANAMVAALRPRLPRRPSRRHRPRRRGRRLAARAMLRSSLGRGGEVVWWRWLRRATRPRPLVLILDVSGSMERYSRFLLRFAHACTRVGAPVEVFVFGTRLTRITRELRQRDPDEALRRVAARVVDWSGGTRIGASLRELNRRWVRRAVRGGAVVLVMSDGWERDDVAHLAREMAVLRRSCHRLLWLDPLASRPGFTPTAGGLRAALPFVDALLPCANVAQLTALADRLVALAPGALSA